VIQRRLTGRPGSFDLPNAGSNPAAGTVDEGKESSPEVVTLGLTGASPAVHPQRVG
jgi:hypothetical protein